MLWADPIQGWVDYQFGEYMPNGELITASSHAAVFDRSVTSASERTTVYVTFALHEAYLSRDLMRGTVGKRANLEYSVLQMQHWTTS